MYLPVPETTKPLTQHHARNKTQNQNQTPTAIRFAICPKENPPPVLKRHPLHV